MKTNEQNNTTCTVELKVNQNGVLYRFELDDDDTLFLEEVIDVEDEHITLEIPSTISFKGKELTVRGIGNAFLGEIDDDAIMRPKV